MTYKFAYICISEKNPQNYKYSQGQCLLPCNQGRNLGNHGNIPQLLGFSSSPSGQSLNPSQSADISTHDPSVHVYSLSGHGVISGIGTANILYFPGKIQRQNINFSGKILIFLEKYLLLKYRQNIYFTGKIFTLPCITMIYRHNIYFTFQISTVVHLRT